MKMLFIDIHFLSSNNFIDKLSQIRIHKQVTNSSSNEGRLTQDNLSTCIFALISLTSECSISYKFDTCLKGHS